MANMAEPTSSSTPQLGWCLALYPRLSRRARRRVAALLVAAALLAQPLASYARGGREAGAAGGNFRAPIAQHAPPILPGDAPPGGSDAAKPYANPAVARALGALGLDAPAAPAALDATPAGSEFQVNNYRTSEQRRPSVARDTDGDFVVVWESVGSGGTDTSSYSIQGQRYNAAGTVVGSQFQVNSYTTDIQGIPSVAMDADGDFVVVWESGGSDGTDTDSYSIQAQRYLPVNPATPQPPTAVDLRYIRAIGLADRAILVWETASEADTLGFQVLRAADAGGPWTPVGPALIPAEGGAASGHTYVLRDAPGPGTWHYRLEDLGVGGKRGAHPAAEVRVGPGAEGSELFVPNAAAGRW